jgi:hypothetical protein
MPWITLLEDDSVTSKPLFGRLVAMLFIASFIVASALVAFAPGTYLKLRGRPTKATTISLGKRILFGLAMPVAIFTLYEMIRTLWTGN